MVRRLAGVGAGDENTCYPGGSSEVDEETICGGGYAAGHEQRPCVTVYQGSANKERSPRHHPRDAPYVAHLALQGWVTAERVKLPRSQLVRPG